MSDARDKALLAIEQHAIRQVPRPYQDGTPEEKQALDVWLEYHFETSRVARRAIWDAAVAARPVPDREAIARVVFEFVKPNNPHGPNSDLSLGMPYASDATKEAYSIADAILPLLQGGDSR